VGIYSVREVIKFEESPISSKWHCIPNTSHKVSGRVWSLRFGNGKILNWI